MGFRWLLLRSNWAARLHSHPQPTESALPTIRCAATDSHEGTRIFFAGDDNFCAELQTSVRPVRKNWNCGRVGRVGRVEWSLVTLLKPVPVVPLRRQIVARVPPVTAAAFKTAPASRKPPP